MMLHVQKLTETELEDFIPFMTRGYLEDFFREESLFLYGIYDLGIPCGVVLFELDGTDVKILHMYLSEENDEELFSVLNAISYDMYQLHARRMLWEFLDDKKATISHRLETLGFDIVQKEIAVFQFLLKELAKAPMLAKPYQNVISLAEVDNVSLRKIGDAINKKQNAMISLPIRKEDYVADCSALYVEKQEVKAILLLQRDENEELYIPYIYSEATEPMAIVYMMRFMFKNASKKFSMDETCMTYVVEPVLVKIIEKITGVKGNYQKLAIRNFELLKYAIRMTEQIFAE